MIIKEGSILKIVELWTTVIENIKVQSDIEIEGDGNGYTFLLRTEGCDENCIFVACKISKEKENYYIVHGFFKEALLVSIGEDNNLYGSYLSD